MVAVSPPSSQAELLERASRLAGLRLSDVASELQIPCPSTLKYAKGWLGQCLEMALGATAGNEPVPDFTHLGIELKTIPVSPQLKPLESTYVCTAPIPFRESIWEKSRVYQKLHCVLWLPIVVAPNEPFWHRRIGQAFMTTLAPPISHIVQHDWEELAEYLSLGHVDKLSARFGTYLHIRPKALNSRTPVLTTGSDGQTLKTVPKGFYLRTALTQLFLNAHYS